MKVVDCAKDAYPEIPRSADDEESNERNLSKLREESVKAKPSTEIVKTLMIRTYPVRRASIMDSSSMVSSILTEMPRLKKCQYVSFNYIHYLTQLCCLHVISMYQYLQNGCLTFLIPVIIGSYNMNYSVIQQQIPCDFLLVLSDIFSKICRINPVIFTTKYEPLHLYF